MRYSFASQSGDKQTLRLVRHQILARKIVRNPLPDTVPEVDILPLREHVCLDSLADCGVEVSENFYDRLRESVTPTYHPVIDLSDESDFIVTVIANQKSIYQRRNTPTGPSTCITEDTNDNMNINIGTSVPLFEIDVGESSRVAKHKVDTLNELDD